MNKNFGRGRRPRREGPREDQGKWIWVEADPVPNSILARRSFSISAKPSSAILKISADTRYLLYINGAYIGTGPQKARYSTSFYDTYDIASILKRGSNTIAVLANFNENTWGRKPGFICRTEIEVGDETTYIDTDETWKVRTADAWTETPQWNEIKFKDKDWSAAAIVGAFGSYPWGSLHQREVSALHEETALPVAIKGIYNSTERPPDLPLDESLDKAGESDLVTITAGQAKNTESLLTDNGNVLVKTPRDARGVAVVVDFGRFINGHLELGIGGSGSGFIDIIYGDSLVNGRVRPNSTVETGIDRITLKKGRLLWRSLEPRGFRYAQIEFRKCSKAVALEYIRAMESSVLGGISGDFECSDDLLTATWKAALASIRACSRDTFTSVPGSGSEISLSDLIPAGRAAYYTSDNVALMGSAIKRVMEIQQRDGSMRFGGRINPQTSLDWIISILEFYAFADDAGLVRLVYPAARRYMKWLERRTDADGLLSNVPAQQLITEHDQDRNGELTSLNVTYYHALRVMGILAAILGKEEESENYINDSTRMKVTINKLLYHPKRGLYMTRKMGEQIIEDFEWSGNLRACIFDVADQYQKSSIIRQITSTPRGQINDTHLISRVIEVLFGLERHYEALDLIRRCWSDTIRSGATTLGSSFDGSGDACSINAVGIARDMIAEIVGIKPILGMHRFSVTPHPSGLRWAKGSIATKTGILSVEWRAMRHFFTINVEVPEGLRVDVYSPCPEDCRVRVDGALQASSIVTLGSGTHTVKVTAERITKRVSTSKALAPKPIPHVEILEDVYQRRGRGRITDERRPRRRKKADDGVVEVSFREEVVDVVAEEPIIDEAAASPDPATQEQTAPKPKRRRTRRSGKRQEQQPEETSQVAETTTKPEAEAPAESTEPVVSEENIQEESKPRRRSHHRRPRRSSSNKAAQDNPAQAETAPEQPSDIIRPDPITRPAETPQVPGEFISDDSAEQQAAPKRKRRPSTRRYTPRKKRGESSETEAEAAAMDETTEK